MGKNVPDMRYLFLIFILSSCVSKKIPYKTVDIQKESINTTLQLSSSNVLTVETLCDSLGKPKSFSNVINNGLNSTIVSVKDNNLIVEVVTDSIVYVDRDILKENTTFKTIYRTPKWAWYYIIIVTILALLGWKVWRLF